MVKTDVEIARGAILKPIEEIAAKIGITPDDLEMYGKNKAKITNLDKIKDRKDGKLILVSAISPTPAGEGKTTVSVGLSDGLSRIGKKAAVALREPSLGPVFGMKGGAAGGGYAQVVPMEDINLHFTGDFHAISSANNLLSAMIDNHIHRGNDLGIDPGRVTWRRVVDMNDRHLRQAVGGLGGKKHGTPRQGGFEITVASEIMAILCLSNNLADLKNNLKNIIIGYSFKGEPITAGELRAHGAMTALLKDAIKPNLVQTLEHTPAFIHGGPFANIAHGCNSVIATKTALKYADYVVTEAGFGADLGAEKFIHIKSRKSGLKPEAGVVVATIRALKMHGGVEYDALGSEDLMAVEKGMPNLIKHLENMRELFGLNTVVALNKFPTDTEAEIKLVVEKCEELGISVRIADVWAHGGAGAEELAQEVVRLADQGSTHQYAYELEDTLIEKLTKLVQKVYGGDGIELTQEARQKIESLEELGYGNLPICMAKTQYSLSDDPTKRGRPTGFKVTIRDAKVSAGAGFVVFYTGDIMTMPGLPQEPAAFNIDVDSDGEIIGLF